MKNMTLIILAILPFLFSAVIFADTDTSTHSITTNTLTHTTTTSTTSRSKDDDIVSAVYAKYAKESALIGTALTVTSQNGVVTISGTVVGQSQADEASIAAKSVAGVKDVVSSISVTTNPNFNKPPPEVPNY